MLAIYGDRQHTSIRWHKVWNWSTYSLFVTILLGDFSNLKKKKKCLGSIKVVNHGHRRCMRSIAAQGKPSHVALNVQTPSGHRLLLNTNLKSVNVRKFSIFFFFKHIQHRKQLLRPSTLTSVYTVWDLFINLQLGTFIIHVQSAHSSQSLVRFVSLFLRAACYCPLRHVLFHSINPAKISYASFKRRKGPL